MAIPGKLHYSPDATFVSYLFSERGDLVRDLWRLDLATGTKAQWLSPPGEAVTEENISRDEALRRERLRLRETGITDYIWAEKANVMLLPLRGELYRWAEGNVMHVAGGGVIDPKVTPDGKRVFFIRDADVWAIDDAGQRRLTSHPPNATSGLAEFVAQEELDRLSGYWPSRSGDRVAFEQVDESNIPIYPVVHQAKATVEVEEHRYPFTGAENARVKLGLVHATDGAVRWLDLPAEDGYIARVDWHPDGRLLVQWLARDWQRLELLAYDPNGVVSALLVEEVKPWVNLHYDLRVVDATGEFIWSSERSGFRHLHPYAPDGRLIRQLTHGDWPGEATVALDVNRRQLYFIGWLDTPLERHLFRVSLDGGEPERLTQEAGIHGVEIAPEFSSFIDVWDNRDHPPSVTVRSTDRQLRHVIHAASPIVLDLRPPEQHLVRTGDGVELHAAIYRPPTPGDAPVIVSVYGGPGPQMVNDSWAQTVDLRAQMLAEHGFVVLKVDNRGSARRGLSFEGSLHRRLGEIEVRDQVEGVRWLGTQGFADISRVGIYGWSYGGELILIVLPTAPPRFKDRRAGAAPPALGGYGTAYTGKNLGMQQDNYHRNRRKSTPTA